MKKRPYCIHPGACRAKSDNPNRSCNQCAILARGQIRGRMIDRDVDPRLLDRLDKQDGIPRALSVKWEETLTRHLSSPDQARAKRGGG